MGWPGSYLPLTAATFLLLLTGGSYLSRHLRRGILLAGVGTLFLYWRLHLEWAEIAFFAAALLAFVVEGLLTWRHHR
jgi:hypothetical protein